MHVHGWLSTAEFTNIVAISQMTPGPVGINSATYCGYTAVNNAGYGMMISMLGSATATFALVLPSFIMMIVIARMFMKYMNTPTVQHIFLGLRPGLDKENFSSWAENPWQFSISVALFVATFVGTYWLHINPIRMIGYAAFAGLVLLY